MKSTRQERQNRQDEKDEIDETRNKNQCDKKDVIYATEKTRKNN